MPKIRSSDKSEMKDWQTKLVDGGHAEWIEDGMAIRIFSTNAVIRRRPDLPSLPVKEA